MGQRLADSGYFVLLPDLFYRAGPYEPFDLIKIFGDEVYRKEVFGKYLASTGNRKIASDATYFLEHLRQTKDATTDKIGVHGYCMGGGMAITVAGTHPDQVVAAASFHGGRLATEEEDSPHRLADKIKARLYIGVAVEDQHFSSEQEAKLKAALDAANLDYRLETYQGAHHGWTMADAPVYNEEAAERHWVELLKLYQETLG
jgi:carboxymethylenebutenolidase